MAHPAGGIASMLFKPSPSFAWSERFTAQGVRMPSGMRLNRGGKSAKCFNEVTMMGRGLFAGAKMAKDRQKFR